MAITQQTTETAEASTTTNDEQTVSDEQNFQFAIEQMTDNQKDVIVASQMDGIDSMNAVAEEVGLSKPTVRYTLAKYLNNNDIPVGESFDHRILSFRDRSFRDLTGLQQDIVTALAVTTDLSETRVAKYCDCSNNYVHKISVVYRHIIEQQREEISENGRNLMAAEIRSELREQEISERVDSLMAEAEDRVKGASGDEYDEHVLEVVSEFSERLEA
jgi:DNA-binding Lrp family transcriptional regulator